MVLAAGFPASSEQRLSVRMTRRRAAPIARAELVLAVLRPTEHTPSLIDLLRGCWTRCAVMWRPGPGHGRAAVAAGWVPPASDTGGGARSLAGKIVSGPVVSAVEVVRW